jgi:hypothetical protein
MNTSNIIVRLEAEQRTAELEILTPHHNPRSEGLEWTLRRNGIRTLRAIELQTPGGRVTRLRLAELDGSELQEARVMQILRIAQERELRHRTACRRAA